MSKYLYKREFIVRAERKQQTSVTLSCYNETLFSSISEPREEHLGLTVGVKHHSKSHLAHKHNTVFIQHEHSEIILKPEVGLLEINDLRVT